MAFLNTMAPSPAKRDIGAESVSWIGFSVSDINTFSDLPLEAPVPLWKMVSYDLVNSVPTNDAHSPLKKNSIWITGGDNRQGFPSS
jgi:hypothetical protein